MAIPLAWIIVGTLVMTAEATIDAYSANEYAKKKKDECEAKYYKSSKQLRSAQEKFDTRLTEIQDHIMSLYQNSLHSSKYVFDSYDISLKELSSLAIPEGYEAIENYCLPELKLTTSFIANFDILKGLKGVAVVGGVYVAGGVLNNLLHTASSTLTNQGVMMISSSISGVKQDASDARLAADKMEKDVDEFVKEVNGMEQIFAIAIAAANKAEEQMQQHLQFFERYLKPCEALLENGKLLDDLSLDETRNLEYLSRILNGMKKFASNPFKVST